MPESVRSPEAERRQCSVAAVGSVRLSGLTLQQATNWVEQPMSKELLRPDLQLRVVKPCPIRVALVGQGNDPASIHSLPVKWARPKAQRFGQGFANRGDAIQKAGVTTQNANLRGVVLQRRLPGTESDLSYKQAELIGIWFWMAIIPRTPFCLMATRLGFLKLKRHLRKLLSWRL